MVKQAHNKHGATVYVCVCVCVCVCLCVCNVCVFLLSVEKGY